MTKLKSAFLAAGIVLAAVPAMAAQPGPYVGVGLGLHMPRTSDVDIGATRPEMEFKDGFGLIGTLGYKTQGSFRTELELGHRSASVGEVAGVEWDGKQSTTSAMLNGLFDLNEGGRFQPYLGLGVGLAWVNWKNGYGPSTTPAITYDGKESEFAYQGIAGFSVPVNERLDMYVDYRYIGVNNLNFPNNSAPLVANHDDRSHNIMLGFRFSFNGPPREEAMAEAAPPPPAPAPAPAAPPSPPPAPAVPQKFIVFFDFDRADLRTDAQRIVAEAFAYAKQTGKSVINATGHADTSGTPAYNLALSERRANAVKAELMRLGLTNNEIVVTWKGESEPLVQTGDGVREPQNRRVEIVLD
jgi:OOP family OmpA-OmpF porin